MPSPLMQRYAGNPVLATQNVPYKATLVFNAGVAKFQGRYVMVFRNDYGAVEQRQDRPRRPAHPDAPRLAHHVPRGGHRPLPREERLGARLAQALHGGPHAPRPRRAEEGRRDVPRAAPGPRSPLRGRWRLPEQRHIPLRDDPRGRWGGEALLRRGRHGHLPGDRPGGRLVGPVPLPCPAPAARWRLIRPTRSFPPARGAPWPNSGARPAHTGERDYGEPRGAGDGRFTDCEGVGKPEICAKGRA